MHLRRADLSKRDGNPVIKSLHGSRQSDHLGSEVLQEAPVLVT